MTALVLSARGLHRLVKDLGDARRIHLEITAMDGQLFGACLTNEQELELLRAQRLVQLRDRYEGIR